mgnify:CR=1 FL=1
MLSKTIESIGQQAFDLHDIEVIVVSHTLEIQQQTLLDNQPLTLTLCIHPASQTI